jgi:hypothetical protein
MVLLLGSVAACASTEAYEAKLNTWLGKAEIALVEAWGPPDSFYEVGGKKYLTYLSASTGYIPGTAPIYHSRIVGDTVHTHAHGGTPGAVYTLSCKTIFTVEGGVIRDWRWQGNDCRSR